MKRILFAIVLLFLAGCAQVRELQGGAVDTAPPMLLAAIPANGTTRFASDRIVLRFNERVKLDRVRDKLLISPPLDKNPDVTVSSGKDVVLTLRAPLAKNTTYTFNLGEAVTDITEGNTAAGLTYVITTGEVLDSLTVRGTVIDAYTDKPEPEVLVTLHSDTDSVGFTTGRPAYFTRTDEQGNFLLSNLRGGRYRAHALKDQNANFRGDLPNERVAFNDALVDAGDSVAFVLRMFLPLAAEQQVKEAAVQPDRAWRIVLARQADSLWLASIDRSGGSLTWTTEWNTTRDTVLFWPSDTTLLNGQRFTLSDPSGTIDTLAYRPGRKMPFNLTVRTRGRSMEGVPRFEASRPIKTISPDRIQLLSDTTAQPIAIEMIPGARIFLLNGTIPDGTNSLRLLPGALRDIYGGVNDTLLLALGTSATEQVGDLKLNLTPDSSFLDRGPYILQLLGPQGTIDRTETFTTLPHRSEFASTRAGVYTVKLIADADGDGRWTTGSLKARRQPERAFRQQGEVNVRAGWEVVVDWLILD